MQEKQVLERAFAMPLTSPAYPPGPYRFVNREYLIITYRTDPARLRAVVPEPLEFDEREALVKYEFIRMPDSNGFGDYTESGQVIPVSFRGRKGSYTHCMFLNDEAHLRARRIPPRGCHDKGRADRARGPTPLTSRLGTRRRVAGSRGRVRNSYPWRSYPRPR
jgi:hypothetical protein